MENNSLKSKNESKAGIYSLPLELIQNILSSDVLTVHDVINFSVTCSNFHEMVHGSTVLWRNRFQLEWPSLEEDLPEGTDYDWRQLFQTCFEIGKVVRERVGKMSRRYCQTEELSNSDFIEFNRLMQSSEHAYHFIMNELFKLYTNGNKDENLTVKFYTEKVIRFICHQHLRGKWHQLLQSPAKQQLLEYAALIVAHWGQPTKKFNYQKCYAIIDRIAYQAKLLLRSRNKDHPIFSVSSEKFVEWQDNNLDDNYYTPEACKEILSVICELLFDHMGFHIALQNCALQCCWLNKVLVTHRGATILIYIIYESVARRLGVKCEIVSFPAHCLLRWKRRYSEENSPYAYVDISSGGTLMAPNSCPRFNRPTGNSSGYRCIPSASLSEVMLIIGNHTLEAGDEYINCRRVDLQHSALELIFLFKPKNSDFLVHLTKFYFSHLMDVSDIRQKLQELPEPENSADRARIINVMQLIEDHEKRNPRKMTIPTILPKPRSASVAFAIGMVMQHRLYHYFCVIYGWDYKCEASVEWIEHMGVNNLECKSDQPFYNVLVNDGSVRYAAQENLMYHPIGARINHFEIGRYFTTFCGNYYVPNTEKEMEYPGDAEVRSSYLTQNV